MDASRLPLSRDRTPADELCICYLVKQSSALPFGTGSYESLPIVTYIPGYTSRKTAMLLYSTGYRTLPKDWIRCTAWLSTKESFSGPSTGGSGGVWGVDGISAATTDPSELSAQHRKAWANDGTANPAEPAEEP